MTTDFFLEDIDLPTAFDESASITFESANLKLRSTRFSIPGLRITLGTKSYNPSPDLIDWLIVETSNTSLILLGLVLMASVFGRDKIILDLGEAGTIDKVIVDKTPTMQAFGSLQLAPVKYEYFPENYEGRYPFSGKTLAAPVSLNVVFEDSTFYLPRERYGERRALYIAGDAEALSNFAAFFLNAGIPEQKHTEFNLERPVGFGGVSHLSAEVRILTERSELRT